MINGAFPITFKLEGECESRRAADGPSTSTAYEGLGGAFILTCATVELLNHSDAIRRFPSTAPSPSNPITSLKGNLATLWLQ